MNTITRQSRMRRISSIRAAAVLATALAPAAARAEDYGAATSGSWSSPSTWTPAAVPGFGDNAYIGSTYPGGAAPAATVTLTQHQQANAVLLGYGAGTFGTLDLGNSTLTAGTLYLGFDGGAGAVNRGTGSFDVGALRLSTSTLAMSGSDKTQELVLRGGSSVTTAAIGNMSGAVRVWSGSTLTLGADLQSGGGFDDYNIEVSGANSTLDAQGHKISAQDLSIGWVFNGGRLPGTDVVQFLNRGDLEVGNLFVANQVLHLTATDQVDGFILSNGSTHLSAGVGLQSLQLQDAATATTTAAGNIIFGASVQSGSTLTLGANLDVTELTGSGFVTVGGDNSTLDAQGHEITATGLLIGWAGGNNVRLLNRGNLTVSELLIGNQSQPFNVTAADQVANFALSNAGTALAVDVGVESLDMRDGATATTSAARNVARSVDVNTGSTLSLGADLTVSQHVVVHGDNSTIDAQGRTITAETLELGWDGGSGVQLLNRGNLAVTNLLVANRNLALGAADQVLDFSLSNGSSNLGAVTGIQNLRLSNGASAATAAAGNLSGSVDVIGSTLTLGADLAVTGQVDVRGNDGTLDAQFHKITADSLRLGAGGGTNARLLNKGELAVMNLLVADQTLNLSAADRVTHLDVRFGDAGTGSIASTAATANVTGSVGVYHSTLNLGADLSVSGNVHVGFDNATINAQGHRISADSLYLGYSIGGTNVRLLNRGNLAVTSLYVSDQDFDLSTADQVANFTLAFGETRLGPGVAVQHLAVQDEATATTASAGNVTGSVDLANVGNSSIESKLTLGADLNLSGHLNALGNTITIDVQGHDITAGALSLEFDAFGNTGSPIQLLNDGAVTVSGPLALAGGVEVELHDGNDAVQSLSLLGGSDLMIKSAATGFTIDGVSSDDLYVTDDGSTLTLELDGLQPGWALRWANPVGGDHVAALSDLIAENQIEFNVINGGEYDLLSRNGYTYIIQPVPEPAMLALVAFSLPILVCRKSRRKTEGRIS